jgi:hypothetical protein
MDVAQFLNPFLLRTNVEVIKSCLPNDGQPPNRLKGPGVIIPSVYISFLLVTRVAQMYDLVVTLNVSRAVPLSREQSPSKSHTRE